ncbi:MAG: TlpA family protein disulfide reductase [Syntrophobacterales bacterium]|jgi:peroxiredoxin|nr:TlpA family protein disulfide reductase [Syntrophobacterales bacterium]
MAQAPVLNTLYNLANQDSTLKTKLKFLAVGKDDNDVKMKMWKAFHKVPFPLLADPDGIFAKALNFSNYPVTMVLDKSGKIVWVHVGAFDNAEEALKGIKAVVK